MYKALIISLLLLNIFSINFAQNFTSKINKGKALLIHITPIGDAYTDPNDEHTIKVRIDNGSYIIEFWKKALIKKRQLSQTEAKEVLNYFESWKNDRCRFHQCGLTYAFVEISIGKSKRKFCSDFDYGREITDKYLKTVEGL